ncbi:uncharacterized protein VTP21DRAFT_11210 [Calcarisporiella thermophila]|uniref:uncharacterized protein n=1 Tax=Calcarisporiella thermophila TaxID=911321 RepID=UPI003743996D
MSHHIEGDLYIRTLTNYLRSNIRRLLGDDATFSSRDDRQQQNVHKFLSFLDISAATRESPSSTSTKSSQSRQVDSVSRSAILTLDATQLYYLLSRFEALGFNIGDARLNSDDRGRTLAEDIVHRPRSRSPSCSSIDSRRSSMTTASILSSWNWWSSSNADRQTKSTIEDEIRYIYNVFSKLPGIRLLLHQHPNARRIAKFDSLPDEVVLSLTTFASLTHLELHRISIHQVNGLDKMFKRLRSLTCRHALSEVSELLDAVRIPTNDSDENAQSNDTWENLKYLALIDNSLTSLTNDDLSPFAASLTHLDLSHNLFISPPPALATLFCLESLVLSHNMINSITGINTMLGKITSIDLRHNRLDNLCGLERLWALEKADVRDNLLAEADEVGRLAGLPNLKEVWCSGNPFCSRQPNYRVVLFSLFKYNNLDITIDGSGPSMLERRQISTASQKDSDAPVAVVNYSILSQPVAETEVPSSHSLKPSSSGASHLGPKVEVKSITLPKANSKKDKSHRKRGARRIVSLDAEPEEGDGADETVMAGNESNNTIPVSGSRPTDSEGEPIQRRHVHRVASLEASSLGNGSEHGEESSGSSPTSLDRRPRSPPRFSARSNHHQHHSVASNSSGSRRTSPTRSRSPTPTRFFSYGGLDTGDQFRRKIEALRNEAGSTWLRVLSEMEYASGTTSGNSPASLAATSKDESHGYGERRRGSAPSSSVGSPVFSPPT